jgi:acetyl-CoA C-acetyltransferase
MLCAPWLHYARCNVEPVGKQVFFGNVCSANLGQAPARQAALKAGLPVATDCTTVNKVCSSGLKAIALGAAAVAAGAHDVVVAGGMESMSNVPYYAPDARQGARLGHSALLDGLLRDGLSDALADGAHMGAHADACAARHGISREAQDAHAVESAARARRAADEGVTAWEIVPVAGRPGRGGGGAAAPAVAADEAVSRMDAAKLRRLPPFFNPSSGGTVTAGNSSPISDGAAAVVLASGAAVRRHGLRALARVRGFGDAAQAPADFPTSPALAVPRALRHAGLAQRDVDFWEVNEAFSAVALVNEHLLGLDPARTNVLGGSVAIGHPIGASGARLVVTLLNVLRARGGRVGVAAICNGGGGASAMVLERVDGGGADE